MPPPSDELLLLDDDATPPSPRVLPWLIAMVDDEPDVHQATIYALSNVQILGRPLRFVSAYSGSGGADLLARHGEGIAVALIDVVMEESDSGLTLVHRLRNEFANPLTRVVLRTGQPGYAPQREVMNRYDINDYQAKNELNFDRLITTLTAAIRAYQQFVTLEQHRRGLDLIVHAAAELSRRRGLQHFAEGVIEQIAAVLGLPPEGVLCVQGPHRGAECNRARVLAAAGSLARWAGRPLQDLQPTTLAELIAGCLRDRRSRVAEGTACLYFRDEAGRDFAVYVDTPAPLSPLNQQLLQVFSANLSTGFDNVSLIERLETLAFVDPLTGLPNRARCRQLLDDALAARQPLAVAALDIDGFSGINNALGHKLGDELLRAIGRRLQAKLGPEVTVARVSSDLFVLFGPPEHVQPDAVLAVFEEPFPHDQLALRVTASLGMVAAADIGNDAIETLRRADIALHQAKQQPDRQYAWFEPALAAATEQRLRLLQQLGNVVQAGGLRVYYQPQLALSGEQVVGVEALLRWQRPDGQFVPPDQFIPLAEASGDIVAIGDWVLRTACRQLAQWSNLGWRGLRMAVNVSLVQFRAAGFVERVAAVLQESGIEASRLELEITESVAMAGFEHCAARLQRLKALGVQVAIDDFGTGFSSLSYLQELAVDRLKIDRSFVAGLPPTSPRLTIAEGVVRLARDLGIPVIAEGVERPEQAECLRRWGCQEVQGYLYGRPMDPDTLLEWLQART